MDDGFQNMFLYQSTLNTLDFKKDNGTVILVGNQRGDILLNWSYYILLSWIA